MLGSLYLIRNNINGKSYVGQTTRKLTTRWSEHRKNISKYPDRPLYRAINKYDIENFSLVLLGEFPTVELQAREIEAIIYYNTYGKYGYNATRGGEGTVALNVSNEVLFLEYKKLGSLQAVAELHKVDRSTIGLKIKELNSTGVGRAKVKPSIRKKVKAVSLDREFNSLSDCAKYLVEAGISDVSIKSTISSLTKACTGVRKTYKKLIFEYI